MSDSMERAVAMGIAALYDIAEEAGKGPITPNLPLRALLALLYEASHQSRHRDRAPFVEFWKTVIDPGRPNQSDHDRNYSRSTHARTHVHRIARTFAMEPQSKVFTDAIEGLRNNQRAALDPEFKARMFVAEAVKQSKYLPRGMTAEELAYHERQGWYEKPRR